MKIMFALLLLTVTSFAKAEDVVAQGASQSAPAAHDSTELAKKLSNPVANLISVPFQFNYDRGY